MDCLLLLVLESLEKVDLLTCQVLRVTVLRNDLKLPTAHTMFRVYAFLLFLICFAYTLVNHFTSLIFLGLSL